MRSSLSALSNGWGYTQSLCCMFGRGARTVSAREMCFPCRRSDPAWRSSRGRQARVSQGSGPAAAEAQRGQVQCLVSALGRTRCGFFCPIEAQTLQLSDSEELDVISANAKDTEDSPPQSHAYEELVEVVTRAV